MEAESVNRSVSTTNSVFTYTSRCRDGSELVDNVSGQKVDIVVAERDAGVADAFAVEVVQFAVIEPYWALEKNTFYYNIIHNNAYQLCFSVFWSWQTICGNHISTYYP
jgi:hypothetical protein